MNKSIMINGPSCLGWLCLIGMMLANPVVARDDQPVKHSINAATAVASVGLEDQKKTNNASIPYYEQSYYLDSGEHDYPLSSKQIGAFMAYEYTIGVESEAPWVRLKFGDAHLGLNSYIKIESVADQKSQMLTADIFDKWQKTSAYFNGSAVKVSLYVAASDSDVFFRVESLSIGLLETSPIGPINSKSSSGTRSICGNSDDRITSNDPAVARIMPVGCTAWITDNGTHVTAGHCFEAPRPAETLHFNVPPSLANGGVQNPDPSDQYMIDGDCLEFQNGGAGNDWAVFSVTNNPVTDEQPVERQGSSFQVVQDPDAPTVRITGFGVDGPAPDFGSDNAPRNTDNQTQQTHSGANTGTTGTNLNYTADTQGGNSGSPVIDVATGAAVGVHTHGGCGVNDGENRGTSATNLSFWNALQTCAVSGTSSVGDQLEGDAYVCYDNSDYTFTLTNPDNLPVVWQYSTTSLQLVSSSNTFITVRALSDASAPGFIIANVDGQQVVIDLWVGKPGSPTDPPVGPSTVRYGAIARYNYFGDPIGGANSFEWWLPHVFLPNATVTIDPQNWGVVYGTGVSSQLDALVGPNNGLVQVMATNPCGRGGARTLWVTVSTTGGGGNMP